MISDEIEESLRIEKSKGNKPKNMYIGIKTFEMLRNECFMPTTVDYDLTRKRFQAFGMWVYIVNDDYHLVLK